MVFEPYTASPIVLLEECLHCSHKIRRHLASSLYIQVIVLASNMINVTKHPP